MAEENQVQQVTIEPQQITKEPQGVTTKNLKKVEAGKRLAECNRKNRAVKKREEQVELERRVNQYYDIGSVIALGVIGSLGYYIYQSRKGEVPNRGLWPPAWHNHPQQPRPQVQPQTNKFEMD